MEDEIEVDDQLITDRLAEPKWPWIIALAYSVEKAVPNAVATIVWALNSYDEGRIRETTTGLAAVLLSELIGGDTYESVIEKIERPIIRAIRAGAIKSFGRESPNSVLSTIDKVEWAGGKIVMTKKSDLNPGDEKKSDNLTVSSQNPNWYYDIHVSANDVKKLVDLPPRPQIHQHAENWTKRALKNHQIAALDFFEISGARWRNGEEGNEEAFMAEYEKWIEKEDRGTPLKRSAFRIWRDRGVQGYKVEGRKLILPE